MTIEERARKIVEAVIKSLELDHAEEFVVSELRAFGGEVGVEYQQKGYRRGLLRAAEIAEKCHTDGACHDMSTNVCGVAERIRKEVGEL